MHIVGKGGKERLVPALAIVSDAIANYMRLCPYALEAGEPLFRGARGGPLSPRLIQLAMEKMRGELGLPETATPHALRHSLPRIYFRPGPIYAKFRAFRSRLALDNASLYGGEPRPVAGGVRSSSSKSRAPLIPVSPFVQEYPMTSICMPRFVRRIVPLLALFLALVPENASAAEDASDPTARARTCWRKCRANLRMPTKR